MFHCWAVDHFNIPIQMLIKHIGPDISWSFYNFIVVINGLTCGTSIRNVLQILQYMTKIVETNVHFSSQVLTLKHAHDVKS